MLSHFRSCSVVLALLALVNAWPAMAAPEPTQGCQPSTPRLPAGAYTEAHWPITQTRLDGTIVTRTFTVHVPANHADASLPAPPLVIDLHGTNLDLSPRPGQEHNAGNLMSVKGNSAGFIVAQPDATPFSTWNGREALLLKGVSDIAFVKELIETLDRKLCFDRSRIFVSGGSNGGHMAAILACESARRELLGNYTIAAIASVIMAPGFPWSNPAAPICPDLRRSPVPTRVILSSRDATLALAFSGNIAKLNEATRAAVGTFARENGCSAESISQPTGATGCGVLAETVTFGCTGVGGGRADTVLDIFDSTAPGCKGHVWPGGPNAPGSDYRTTDVVLKFFLDHPR